MVNSKYWRVRNSYIYMKHTEHDGKEQMGENTKNEIDLNAELKSFCVYGARSIASSEKN